MDTKKPETPKSIFRNVIYGFSTWILPLGLSFLATPIIVKSLGNEDYGIYALVLGFIGYSFNLNLGRAITKYIAEYRVRKETEKINYIISNTLIINLILGLIGVFTICLLANWLVSDVFLIDARSQTKTVTAFYISAGIIFVTMLNQVFNSILQGLHRFDKYSKLYNANSFAIIIGNIVLALYGFNLIALLLWNLFVLFIIGLVTAFTAKSLLPEFKFVFKVEKETFRLIIKFSSGIIAYQILSNFLLLFERGWIIRYLGEESLTFYVIPMLLGIYIHSFISSLTLVIFPLASELNENIEKLKRLYLKATKIVCAIVFFCSTTLIIESKLFLAVWMGNNFAEQSWLLLIIHAITFGLLAILIVSWQMTEGLGYPNYNSLIFAICLVINLSLMVYLTEDFGNTGIALARLAGFGTMCLSIFYVEKWFFKEVQIKFWIRILSRIGLAAVLSGVVEYLLIQRLTESWASLLVVTLSGGVIYCMVLWVCGFIAEDEKELVRSLIKN
jgi:O-antigen/teichoic acid export membrane protein